MRVCTWATAGARACSGRCTALAAEYNGPCSVCACRRPGLVAARRRLALGQRGLVDAALGPEHGCGDHHGQMGVQVGGSAHAPLPRSLQLYLVKPQTGPALWSGSCCAAPCDSCWRSCSQAGLVLLTGMGAAAAADCSTEGCCSLLNSLLRCLLGCWYSRVPCKVWGSPRRWAITGSAPQRLACWGGCRSPHSPSKGSLWPEQVHQWLEEVLECFPADRMTSD